MIRVPIVPVRQRDRARPALPDEPDDVGNLRVGADDAAVGPAQVDAPGGAEHLAGIFSFALALVGRAVRAQLAACQVAETDAIAARRMDGHGSGRGRSRCRRDEGRRPGGPRGGLCQFPTSNSQLPSGILRPTANTANQRPKSVALRPVVAWRLPLGVGSWELEVDMTASESELDPQLHLPLVVGALRRERRRQWRGQDAGGVGGDVASHC